MKTSDLRIGNYVKEATLGVVVVYAIGRNSITVATIPGAEQLSGLHELEISRVEPVNITEEWMMKFDFALWSRDERSDKYGLYNAIDGTSDFEVTVFKDNAQPTIDDNCCFWGRNFYVHTLQNLFQSLTGWDLTTKE